MKKIYAILILLFTIQFSIKAQDPSTLLSFTATMQDKTVLLVWTTASGDNVKFYWVEYSLNGSVWNIIGTVNASAAVEDIHSYSFLHNNPAKGVIYYRLLEMSRDGSSSFSNAVNVKYNNRVTTEFYVYPNPVSNGNLQIHLKTASPVSLYNQFGQMLIHRDIPAGDNSIGVNNFAKGVYVLKVGAETLNIVIQ